VMREGLPARNWQDLETEAQQEVYSRQGNYSSYLYPLSRELAQKAEDFEPFPPLFPYLTLFASFICCAWGHRVRVRRFLL
jgi:hypothetical protein